MGTSIPLRSNGQVIDQSWFNLIRTEVSVIDDRVDALGSNNALIFNVNGYYGEVGSANQVSIFPITKSLTITSAKLICVTAGSAGSTKVDFKFKRGSGAWTSIFSTLPIVPFGAGDLGNSDTGAGATAAVINPSNQVLLPGDMVRVDQFQVQGGTPDTYILNVYHDFNGVTV